MTVVDGDGEGEEDGGDDVGGEDEEEVGGGKHGRVLRGGF